MCTEKLLFSENIERLRRRDSTLAERILKVQVPEEYAVLRARTGDPVLKIKNKTIHSIYNPKEQAARFVDHHLKKEPLHDNSVTVVGFGFGYHVEELLRRNVRVRVIEPDEVAFRCALENRDLKKVIDACEIRIGSEFIYEKEQGAVVWYYMPEIDDTVKNSRSDSLYKKHSLPSIPISKSLKILVISPIYGGSLPISYYCDNALKRLGHQSSLWDASMFEKPFRMVLDLDIDHQNKKVLCDLFQHLISEMIVATCAERKPDMVFCLAQAPLSIHALERLREVGIINAFWFVEDFRFMRYWEMYAPAYDFYFTIQKGEFLKQLERVGARACAYLPVAADPDIHRPLVLTADERSRYGSDLSFLGAGYYNRQCMFKGLIDFDLKIWGTEWDRKSILWPHVQDKGRRISTEEAVKIFNASKININLHSSDHHDGVTPDGDFINPRTFEIASCAAFQLVDRRADLEYFFDIGREIVCFSSLEELREKAAYYLRHPDGRSAVASAGRKRILADHTYEHRMRDMCKIVLEQKPEMLSRKHSRSLAIQNIDDFCRKHPETRHLIEEVTTRGLCPDLDTIAATIRSRSKELEYPEAIFMIMKEYQKLVKEHLR